MSASKEAPLGKLNRASRRTQTSEVCRQGKKSARGGGIGPVLLPVFTKPQRPDPEHEHYDKNPDVDDKEGIHRVRNATAVRTYPCLLLLRLPAMRVVAQSIVLLITF